MDNNIYQIILFLLLNNKKRLVACIENSDGNIDAWEDIHMICPNQCVCQHAPFMDLSIARWIQGLRREEADPMKNADDSLYSNVIFNEVISIFGKSHAQSI